MELRPFSFGIGDRFALQGIYQLQAFDNLAKKGIHVTPVWNKSNREHNTVGSRPSSVMTEAKQATEALKWQDSWFVDADHIDKSTVDDYLSHANYFTIDVASSINSRLSEQEKSIFIEKFGEYEGEVFIDGLDTPFRITREFLEKAGDRYWKSAMEAGKIYRHIAANKKYFIAEISMDEVEHPQTPPELYLILAMLADQDVMMHTLAPKFTGRFNKGVDYEGDLNVFAREFEQDLLVLKTAVKHFDLPAGLKLSIHTGSDKFSLYPVMKTLVRKHHMGIHVKTAGTTWLEECIGLALSGDAGLDMVKQIYREATERYEELTVPYTNVLNIEMNRLMEPADFDRLSAGEAAETIRHEPENPMYHPDVRQLLHTAYKIAAEKGDAFLDLVRENASMVGKQVYDNLYERHLTPLFL